MPTHLEIQFKMLILFFELKGTRETRPKTGRHIINNTLRTQCSRRRRYNDM